MNCMPLVLSLKIIAFAYVVTDSLNLYQISKPYGLFSSEHLKSNQIIENALKCIAPICLLSFVVSRSSSKIN